MDASAYEIYARFIIAYFRRRNEWNVLSECSFRSDLN